AFGSTANTITFPSAASYTVAGLSVAQTFTADQTVSINDTTQFTIDNPSGQFSVIQFTNAGSLKGQIYYDNTSPLFVFKGVANARFDLGTNNATFLSLFPSKGIYVGDTTVDPGANNFRVQGTVTINGITNVAVTSAVCVN